MRPLIAIVGRPNVGKSTLFNRLVGKQLAIVADQPGVTRDRHYADARLLGRGVTLVDTGGFDPRDEDPMHQGIVRGVRVAIEQADVVLCVLDASGPPTEADAEAVQLLRKAGVEVVYFGNRADNPRQEAQGVELYRLGIDPLIIGSALHGRRVPELQQALLERLPPGGEEEEDDADVVDDDGAADDGEADDGEADADARAAPAPKGPVRIALLGRPNAGKSSLLNALSGQELSLVDARPGTTRDPIDASIEYRGRPYRVVDTAGVRRKARVQEDVEAMSVMRALRVMGEADVVVLLCDASGGLSEQDAKLLALAADRGRPVLVALNKMDLLTPKARAEAISKARDVLHFAPWSVVLPLSVKTGTGLPKLMQRVDEAHAEFTRRVPTAQLNRFVQEVLERNPPPSAGGRSSKIYYLTQVHTAPPLFVAMCSTPKALPEAYRRFVQNQLRTAFGFDSIGIRVRFRARRRRDE